MGTMKQFAQMTVIQTVGIILLRYFL